MIIYRYLQVNIVLLTIFAVVCNVMLVHWYDVGLVIVVDCRLSTAAWQPWHC